MSMKPTMSAEVEEMNVEVAIGSVLGWFADDTTLPRDIKVALTKLVKTSRKHLSCAQTPAQMVAALIAEGGEIKGATGESGFYDVRGHWEVSVLRSGDYLVFRIPVESAEAKETPDSRDTGEKP